MPVWRREDESRSLALIITRGAFEALGIEPDAAAAEATPASQGAGKAASKRRAKEARSHIRSSAKGTQEGPEAEAAPRTGTKQALVITLLQREHGATIDDLIAATQWLPHTIRAALTGLRKKGYGIAKNKGEDGKTIYRIEADPQAGKESAASVSSEAA
jgi:DNA-binding MarR family transcriptional regulator